jgi:hypothetical protein
MSEDEVYKPRWFKPLTGAPKERGILAFDVEGTGGPGGFVCGAISGDVVSSFFTDPEEMLQVLLRFGAEGYWIFAHNLEYDLPVLEGEKFPRGELLFTPNRLLWSTYEYWKKKVKFYDSRNLFPRYSVAGLGELVGAQKLDPGPGVLERLGRGASWGQFNESDQEKIRRYVRRDAEIVFLAVSMLQDITLRVGGQLKPTIAGVAMDVYRRKYHKWPWRALGPETNKLARPAYYGGRVENFYYGQVPGVNAYDLTSLYPSVQAVARFPHTHHLQLDLYPRSSSKWLSMEGVAQVRLRVKDSLVPPLPHRYDHRLFFPSGEMSGLWSIMELRANIGNSIELISCDWVLGSKVTFNPFERFVEDLFKLREGYLFSGSGAAHIIKLILNSLYGRFGLNPERSLRKLVSIEKEPDWRELRGFETEIINGRAYAYGPVESQYQPDYVNTLFAAQITSAARLVLFEELARQGEKAVYCDTDSILTTGTIPESAGLGGWRLEEERVTADLLGPKEYALHNEFWGDKYVVKGVPEAIAEAYFKEGAARFWRALSVREALRDGKIPATWVETFRRKGQVLPKREPLEPVVWPEGQYYPTRPYRVQDLPQVVAGSWSRPDRVPDVPEKLRPQGPGPQQIELD